MNIRWGNSPSSSAFSPQFGAFRENFQENSKAFRELCLSNKLSQLAQLRVVKAQLQRDGAGIEFHPRLRDENTVVSNSWCFSTLKTESSHHPPNFLIVCECEKVYISSALHTTLIAIKTPNVVIILFQLRQKACREDEKLRHSTLTN